MSHKLRIKRHHQLVCRKHVVLHTKISVGAYREIYLKWPLGKFIGKIRICIAAGSAPDAVKHSTVNLPIKVRISLYNGLHIQEVFV
jgi:hypothetical protein